jgi:hypothetical protein
VAFCPFIKEIMESYVLTEVRGTAPYQPDQETVDKDAYKTGCAYTVMQHGLC